ncbi:MAG: hypothetical protein RMJ36_00415 [Candidatus Calescibacterium sp.]|nr:hypothetical protein [Candidatus Calescibacterium sp.]MDW8132108.1 hypothetical protein [Candidatus Calescibacterium sp.]
MINIKYRIFDVGKLSNVFEKIVDATKRNLLKEKKYELNGNICVYKIDDFIFDNNKIFIFNFYYERTNFYDFKQSFVSKFIFNNDELIYLMDSVGYVFITDFFVKTFSRFWNDVYSDIFEREQAELVYKNF